MQIIPSSMLPERDKESLRAFLGGCRETAQAKGHFQLASISLAVKHIAPLAVLQSIHDPNELHFYIERPADEEALAGAEAVCMATFSGPERFAQVKAYADEILANTISVGDLSAAFTGPHFFTAFSFNDTVPEGSAFAAATVFVPRWQVSRCGADYGAVANVRVDADCDLDQLVEKVWAAYLKFASFDYAHPTCTTVDARPPVVEQSELAEGVFADGVTRALAAIDRGAYEKIVLARGLRLEADQPWKPLDALNRLRERFSGCFTFSYSGGEGRSFIGATPERLLKLRNGRLQTEAIAGSAPRGATAGEDARLARDLLDSDKNQHEHNCVRDSIVRRLQAVGVEGKAEATARLLPLANVQHLRTQIEAEVGTSVHLLDIVAEMHPTPAVGGTPREQAVPEIAELEQLDRGLFAGAIGWFNHLNDGEMVVAIRSALIEDTTAELYAGAGIVHGSDPQHEARETEMKLSALLDVLTDPQS
jgi:menaquinone-specific isochorismate synthase